MEYAKIIDHIVGWLKDYTESSRTNGFVIGVSGGIDSALTSTLCALTGKKTILVEMPIHQDESQVSRGKKHISFLVEKYPNCSSLELNMTDTYDVFLAELRSNIDLNRSEEIKNLTLGNSRARLRMSALYAVAGIEGLLVAGTGNKVEDFGVGFFTKYGDGGVDISPIADLFKTEVYALAKYLNVNQNILEAPPTDGLWDDGRTDEDQIGATYAELEAAMRKHETLGDSLDQIQFLSEREREVWEIYFSRWKANQHKMNPIPVCEIPEDLKE
ncbi:NAD(+) synthase [bacterium SCSIO 12643]|nr:NAD(+) synthase [bacterium SCSIO 12643]